jgi:hypothetical protein
VLESRIVAPALRLAGMAARMLHVSTDLLPEPLNPSLAALLRQDIRLDPHRAVEQLGLRLTELEEGMRQSARFLASASSDRATGQAKHAKAMEVGQR